MRVVRILQEISDRSVYKKRNMRFFTILTSVLISLLSVSCRTGTTDRAGDYIHSALQGKPEYASRFTLHEEEGFTRLDIIDPWQGASGIRQTWYLVPAELAEKFVKPGEGNILTVPVDRIVCMSATHVAMIAALGKENTICGVSGTDLIYNRSVRKAIDNGLIREIGYDENTNRELLVDLDPDLIIAYGIGGESAAGQGKLSELGLTVMFNADYLEDDPLGKAEWIRVFGALFCVEEKADSVFLAASTEYTEIKNEVAAKAGATPGILLGLPWKDSWFISPGNSYISRLVQDAGGQYLWHETQSDFSMPYNLENVYIRAVNADLWLNPGSASSLNEIEAADYRLKLLPVFESKMVFNNNRRITPSGANDYWETGTVRPGLILKDIAKIINKELFREDSLFFYRKLE